MGTARTLSSRRRWSRTTGTTKDNSNTQGTSNRSSSNYYESFAVMQGISRSRSRSPSGSPTRSRSRSPSRIFSGGKSNKKARNSTPVSSHVPAADEEEDPGNPLGNAVDFCVTSLQSLHQGSVEMTKSCHEPNLEQFLSDLFLCNLKLSDNKGDSNQESTDGKASARNGGDGKSQDASLLGSSGYSKKEKNGWKKKKVTIMPGKKFIRSMSLKRKNPTNSGDSSTNASSADGKQTLVSRGSKAGSKPDTGESHDDKTLKTIASDDSEDSIFANLEDDVEPDSKTAKQPEHLNENRSLVSTPSSSPSSTSSYPLFLQTASFYSPTTETEESSKNRKTGSKRGRYSGDEDTEDESGLEQETTFDDGIENDDDGNDCHLFFCALPETLEDGTVDQSEERREQRSLLEEEASRDPKPTSNKTKLPKISIVPQSIPTTITSKAQNHNKTATSRNKKIRKHSKFGDEDEFEPKIEFEMILDDSRFGHRKWGKITPWKKLFSASSSTSSPSLSKHSTSSGKTSKSSLSKKLRKGRSSSIDGWLKSKSKSSAKDQSSQLVTTAATTAVATAAAAALLNSKPKSSAQDPSNQQATTTVKAEKEKKAKPEVVAAAGDTPSRDKVEPLSASQAEDPDPTERNARVMRKRRLQSALRSSSFGSGRSKAVKPKRSAWRKMLVVSVPPGEQEHPSTMTDARQKDADVEIAGQDNEAIAKPNSKKTKEEEQTEDATVTSKKRGLSKDSGNDEGETTRDDTTKKSNKTNTDDTATVKDQSATSVMGLQNWSWGVFALADTGTKTEDEEDEEDFNRFIEGCQDDEKGGYGGWFGGGDDITDHDSWIMDEDQLESYSTDDDTKRTSEYSFATSSNCSQGTYDEDDDDETVDREFQKAIAGAAGSRSQPGKATSNPKDTMPKATTTTSKRKSLFTTALSKSIRRNPFSNKKKKKSKTNIDVSNDISVEASEQDGDNSAVGDRYTSERDPPVYSDASVSNATIETVLREKPTTSTKATATNNSLENRDDASTTSDCLALPTSLRVGLNPKKTKMYWKDQSKPKSTQSNTTSPELVTVNEKTKKGGNQVQWNTIKSPSRATVPSEEQEKGDDETNNSRDIITVIKTNSFAAIPNILSQKSNEYLDRYAALFDQADEDEYGYDTSSYASSSTTSRSWARDNDNVNDTSQSWAREKNNNNEGSWARDNDEYVQPEGFRFGYNNKNKSLFPPSEHDVIRE